MRAGWIGLMAAVLWTVGCGSDGPNEVEKVLQNIQYDVGGAVVDEVDEAPLNGVAIAINGIDALALSATTDAFGLWTVEDLDPGIYQVTYTLANYDTEIDQFALEAVGENDVADPFVSLGTQNMTPPGAVAAIGAPFSIDVEDGDTVVDGLDGMTLVYALASDGDIVVTFDRPVFGGDVTLEDDETGDTLTATVDLTDQIFTLLRTDIDLMDGGNGLFADMNPSTRHRLRIQNFSYTQGNNQRQFDADVRFNCVP